ncbi:AtzE family amidohydrolase [soil metagenome]
MELFSLSAVEIAKGVRERSFSARQVVESALARIELVDPQVNAFTQLTQARALAEAESIDRLSRTGAPLPALAGVPYAVKNLFDLAGVVTLAGSKVLKSNPPAMHDATLVRRMKTAGGICVGALNMDEFAYGFTTENSHVGACRNPHDTTRIAGGSSGGCGAAVAAGMVPLSLGSDTNGSIRVPSSLCGTFGLKPTYGRLSRSGSFPFVGSLDHLGPFARSVEDLALSYDACQGPDAADHACRQKPVQPTAPELAKGIGGLRIARLAGYFDEFAGDLARAASRTVAHALNVKNDVELPDAAIGRAAAFVITSSEGGALHLPSLRDHYEEYEPMSRDRFMAGALNPAAWYLQAQRFRSFYLQNALKLFEHYDILIAPATPCQAPLIGTDWLDINGKRLPAKPSMGLLTQPISFIGLPVAVVPVVTNSAADGESLALPIGVQVIAAPWREDLALRVAAFLEQSGVAHAPLASL